MPDPDAPQPTSGGPAQFDYDKIQAMMIEVAIATAIAKDRIPSGEPGLDPTSLRAEYQTAVDMVKVLTDIRFRCLTFVTAIAALANTFALGADAGSRMALGLVGLLATLGILVYDLRNSQLYDAAMHRAKELELRLHSVPTSHHALKKGGLFNERPDYVPDTAWKKLDPAMWRSKKQAMKDASGRAWRERRRLKQDQSMKEYWWMSFWGITIKHDLGLAWIYSAAIAAWVYLSASGLLSLPSPGWPTWSKTSIHLLAAGIALTALRVSLKSLYGHDKDRYRPKEYDYPGRQLLEPTNASVDGQSLVMMNNGAPSNS